MNDSFHINIFCLTAEYHKQLPSEFLNLGYKVSSSWGNNKFTFTKGIVSIISYDLIYTGKDRKSNSDVCDDIKIAFNNIKGYFYGATANVQVMIGNINGDTDISRVFQMKALW